MRKFFSNWPLSRVLYLSAGILFIVVAVMDQVWFMVPVGLYFAAMAVFRFGCAGGSCGIPEDKSR